MEGRGTMGDSIKHEPFTYCPKHDRPMDTLLNEYGGAYNACLKCDIEQIGRWAELVSMTEDK